jgi:UDP-3-O-[3-hydroxymyristoyl] glucosamine N-acyltransferase
MWQLHELAKLVGGTVLVPSSGDVRAAGENSESDDLHHVPISGAAAISFSQPDQITLVTSDKYLQEFETSPATAAVVGTGLTTLKGQTKPCIQVANPAESFSKIVALFRTPVSRPRIGISPSAEVALSAKISEDVCIYPGAVIMDNVEIGCGSIIFPNVTVMENCRIGSHVKIFPGAVLYENTVIGDRCIIHGGVVLGAYGFGYHSSTNGHQLSPQLGNVVIESDVEIGANCTIDRGTYDSTVIGEGSKLDDAVMIGHNCRIGKHNLLCSQVGIAGSCQTGDFVVMGGQVGLADHLNIGNGAQIAAKSGLMHDVEPGQRMFGTPARPAREEMQLLASRAKLPEMRKTIRKMEKQIEQLTAQYRSTQGFFGTAPLFRFSVGHIGTYNRV